MKIRLLAGSILCFSLAAAAEQQNIDVTTLLNGNTDRTTHIKDSDLDMFRDLAEKYTYTSDKDKKTKVKAPIDLTLTPEQKQKLDEYTIQAKQIAQPHLEKLEKEFKTSAGETVGNADLQNARYTTLVFASLSMPEDSIKEMYRSLAGDRSTSIVFRGMPKGTTTINQAIRKFQDIAHELNLKVTPNVIMNPILFREYNVTEVPTIIRLESPTPNRSGDPKTMKPVEHPKEVASVQGLITPYWLYDRIKEGKRGYLGRQGSVYKIEEIDIEQEMKNRAAKVDWEEKKKGALARAWQNVTFETLTPAVMTKKRIIDPTFELQQDIKGSKGELIAQKGVQVNPLMVRNFDRLLVVFDPTDKRELSFIEHHLPEWKELHNMSSEATLLILTDVDRESGFEGHDRLVKRMNSRLYLLQKDVKDTFKLRHHPSLVYQLGTNFVVEEFKID